MANTFNNSSCSVELIDPRFVFGLLPPSTSTGEIYRPIPRIQGLDPISGVAMQSPHPVILQMDVLRTFSLLQLMREEGLLPSHEEVQKRNAIIRSLKEILQSWIQEVAMMRNLPDSEIRVASATILTYGSYGLGVYGSESDIDALCVGPWFTNITEDFFILLYTYLKNTHKASDVRCIKGAKVPLMRFKFEGISIDLTFAQLHVKYVPDNVNLLNPIFLTNIDEVSWKSLSGVRLNQFILQTIPNLENFKALLRCLKFWAKQRGVYGNLFGFLGGVHLAILAAFICQRSLTAGLSVTIISFFDTFASWPWPLPVALQDGLRLCEDMYDRRFRMPIRLPCTYELCQSNVTRSTFNRIKREFIRGQNITKNITRPDFDWRILFEPFVYEKTYPRFLKIYLAASSKDDLVDWVGWVKSRFRSLILKLEDTLSFCDPNPTEYTTTQDTEGDPSMFFCWGLSPCECSPLNIVLVQEHFWKNISTNCNGKIGKMRLSVVHSFKAAQQQWW